MDMERLRALAEHCQQVSHHNAGYPCNQAIDFSPVLPLFHYNLNNLGDPFSGSSYRANTYEFEREVLAFFADLLKLQGDYRGYVASCSTEGNFYGISLGIQRYPDAVLYFSESAHYSLPKTARLTRTPYEKIRSLPTGEMDYRDLARALAKHPNRPAVINATLGTTMTEASDNLAEINRVLAEQGIVDFHLHVDAALSGIILPFCERADAFNFAQTIHSYCISGHKFLGTPMPCSVALSRQTISAEHVEYANLEDSTIGGSRNAHASLLLWYAIQVLGKAGIERWVNHCLAMTDYALAQLTDAGIAAWKNPCATTLIFPKPSEAFVKEWWLLTEGRQAHWVIKSNTDKAWVDRFVGVLQRDMTKLN